MLEGAKSIGAGAATIASAGAAVGVVPEDEAPSNGGKEEWELSSLEKFPRPDRGLGGVRIEDSLNRNERKGQSFSSERLRSGLLSRARISLFRREIGLAWSFCVPRVSLPIELQRFWSGSRSLIKNRSSYIISILLFNGKLSNDKFSSAGKLSFTDMGAYSAVAGLVSISFPYDFEKGMDREEGSRVSFSWCQHRNGSCLNGCLFPLLNQPKLELGAATISTGYHKEGKRGGADEIISEFFPFPADV
ncbi:hypothetical protein TSUD_291890 [Trifolium subterraneum]|uniref:Uncharacterized protein n=1 Tax=Trifolium subterraneum TaxID=3900 RepID=A0A2Z6P1Y4_TRISU|nr:hypothetical protein TSUD_291890 [Trifolium subterraneum]